MNIGFLLGVDLVKQHSTYSILMVSLSSGKSPPLDHGFLKYKVKKFYCEFFLNLKLYEISADFMKVKNLLRGRGYFVVRICT